jgi:hypothetical protein
LPATNLIYAVPRPTTLNRHRCFERKNEVMAKRCIVCGDPAGSGEHIFPACLEGLRVNNGIYCEPDNNGYGPLAAQLGTQLAFFNAHCGIRNSRTKQIKPARLKDSTGAEYDYDGHGLKPVWARILSQDGNQTSVGFPDKASADRFREQLEAQGIKVETGAAQVFHPDQLGINLVFGGPEGMRAVGYVAQTFLAHCFPDLARNPAIKPFLDYTLKGTGDNFVWWDFDAPSDLPPNAFDFGHRIIVGADNERASSMGACRFSRRSTSPWCFTTRLHPCRHALSLMTLIRSR